MVLQFNPTVNNTPASENNPVQQKPPRKHCFLITLMALLVITGIFGVWYFSNPLPEEETEISFTSTPKIIGGDKDAGGCLIGAGYSWCQVKNKCLRVWEEKCVLDNQTAPINEEETRMIEASIRKEFGVLWIGIIDGCGETSLEKITKVERADGGYNVDIEYYCGMVGPNTLPSKKTVFVSNSGKVTGIPGPGR